MQTLQFDVLVYVYEDLGEVLRQLPLCCCLEWRLCCAYQPYSVKDQHTLVL